MSLIIKDFNCQVLRASTIDFVIRNLCFNHIRGVHYYSYYDNLEDLKLKFPLLFSNLEQSNKNLQILLKGVLLIKFYYFTLGTLFNFFSLFYYILEIDSNNYFGI